MKKLVGKIGSWGCYYVGHMFSILAYRTWFGSKKSGIPYRLYSTFMIWSSYIQDWGGKGPWKASEDNKKA